MDYVLGKDFIQIRVFRGASKDYKHSYRHNSRNSETRFMLGRIRDRTSPTGKTWFASLTTASDSYFYGNWNGNPPYTSGQDPYFSCLPGDYSRNGIPGYRHNKYAPNRIGEDFDLRGVTNSSNFAVKTINGWERAYQGACYHLWNDGICLDETGQETLMPGPTLRVKSGKVYTCAAPGSGAFWLPGGMSAEGAELVVEGSRFLCRREIRRRLQHSSRRSSKARFMVGKDGRRRNRSLWVIADG